MKPYRIRLKTVSPLHVGTGEIYEPTEFFVHTEGYLGILDFEKFVSHFDKNSLFAFKKLCQKGTIESLVKLYILIDGLAQKFLKEGIEDFVLRRVKTCAGFLSHYKSIKELLKNNPSKLKNEFNKFTIYRTAFSPNKETPIIPGSAVKGAIRTAILNLRRKKVRGKTWQNYCDRRCDSKRLESEILAYPPLKFHQDPFRLIKVSDFRPVNGAKIKILYAVNRKKDGGVARGPYQILEVVEAGTVFEGEITILDPEKTSGIKDPVTLEEIKEALREFFGKESDREFEILSRLGADLPSFPAEGLPLRIGRHSGAECVTIEGFRHILIRGPRGRNRYKDQATTLWLASEFKKSESSQGLKPFGWVAFLAETFSGSAIDPSPSVQNPRFKLRIKGR